MTEKKQPKHTVTEIRQLLQQASQAPLSAETNLLLEKLANDQRQGVQRLRQAFLRKQAKLAAQYEKFNAHLAFEREAWEQGSSLVAGIDEVGRGPLAGPVVAAAVILPHNFAVYEVNDSKQLSAGKREALFPLIMQEALAVGIGLADNQQIDDLNIYQATRLAMAQAVAKLAYQPDLLLVDAMTIQTSIPQKKLIKGDARSVSIGAASIVAKVTRDHLMADYAKHYPGYGFEKNAGYGTAQHLAGIAQHGITPLHRQTFEPIKSQLKK